jgi:hypothetical protein
MKEHFDTASTPRLAGGKSAMEVKRSCLALAACRSAQRSLSLQSASVERVATRRAFSPQATFLDANKTALKIGGMWRGCPFGMLSALYGMHILAGVEWSVRSFVVAGALKQVLARLPTGLQLRRYFAVIPASSPRNSECDSGRENIG